MKDQRKLLNTCLQNEIPAIVFQGTDSCSVEILNAALDIYKRNGCSEEFLYDFKTLIDDFKGYQAESADVKLPGLSDSEKALVRQDMDDLSDFPEEIQDFQRRLKEGGFTLDNFDVRDNTYKILRGEYTGISATKGDYTLVINKTSASQLNFIVHSDVSTKYPTVVGDYDSFKTCFADIVAQSNSATKGEELCTAGFRSLIVDTNPAPGQITNPRIKDHSTGKTEPLDLKDIDLSKQPDEELKKLLSGGKAELIDQKGVSKLASLTKGPSGWALQGCQQIFAQANANAEM